MVASRARSPVRPTLDRHSNQPRWRRRRRPGCWCCCEAAGSISKSTRCINGGGGYPRRVSRRRVSSHSVWMVLWTTAWLTSYSQAGDAYTTGAAASSSYPLNLVPTQNFCERHEITVSSLSILCDTPGAYYSGSNAYRNSPVCISNDKAKLQITFRIPSGLTSSDGSTSSFLYVQVELGLYDRFSVVQQPTLLCKLNVVQSSSSTDASASTDPTECPHAGVYEWSAVYSVPVVPDSTLHYTPDVRLTFLNEQGQRVGCVVSGPIALQAAADAKAVAGLVALGIAVSVFMSIFALLLFVSHRRRLSLEKSMRHGGSNGGGTGGAMHYQYFRTLPNGQVVPVVGHPRPQSRVAAPRKVPVPPPRQPPQLPVRTTRDESDDDDDDSENALNISNPAYNETQLPSRPII